MQQQTKLTHKLETVLEPQQAVMLAEVITDAYNDLVRTTIEGEEINIFGRDQRLGQDVLLVGETKLRLEAPGIYGVW